MISDQLLASICCPRCHSRLDAPDDDPARTPWTLVCTQCGTRYAQPTRDYVDLRPPTTFAEQTKYLDEALHADARHETVSPPLLAAAIRQRQLRRFLRLAPGDDVIDLGCGSGRSLLWNAASGARLVGTDVSPYFAREARARVPLALGDLRQLPFPDGTFTKGYALDVLEHLSPEALDAMLREAARILAPGGVLFVYSHVRKNSPLARGLRAINALARGLERIGLIDMTQERLRKSDHLNPLRDVPHLEEVVAAAGFRVAKIRYYTPLVGGFVENILMRVAEHAMAKRAARRAAMRDASDDAPPRAVAPSDAVAVAGQTPHPPAPLSPGTSGERRVSTPALGAISNPGPSDSSSNPEPSDSLSTPASAESSSNPAPLASSSNLAQRDLNESGTAPDTKSNAEAAQEGAARAAVRTARTEAKARIARQGPVYWVLRGLTWAMELDIILFSRIRTGPFFALLEKRADAAPGRADRPASQTGAVASRVRE